MQYLERESWGSNKARVFKNTSTGDAGDSLQTTLLQLMRKKKHRGRIMQIIEDSGPRISSDCDPDLLLRQSKKHRNPELFALVLESKRTSDAEVPDLTSLAASALAEDWPSARQLYNAHVDEIAVQLHGYRSKKKKHDNDAYSIELYERSWSIRVLVPRLAARLSRDGSPLERVADALHKLYCDLHVVVSIGDAELTRAFLPLHGPFDSAISDCSPAYRLIVRDADATQLEALLDYNASLADPCSLATQLFGWLVKDIGQLLESAAGRVFARNLLRRRHLFDDLEYLESALVHASRENLEALLELRALWGARSDGRELLASAFGNRDPEVLQLLRESKVDVDARGSYARTSLHFAADRRAVESVGYLLGRGADPNAVDEFRGPPLRDCLHTYNGAKVASEGCARLLLVGGADPLLVYCDEVVAYVPQFFGIETRHLRDRECAHVVECLLAELAASEALGRSVDGPIDDCRGLMGREYTERFYEECRRQLEELRSHRIRDDGREFTMFDLMSERGDRAVRWIGEDDRRAIAAFMRTYESDAAIMPYYRDALKYRIEMLDRMSFYVEATKGILSECMRLADSDHLVIRTIISFLTLKDVLSDK